MDRPPSSTGLWPRPRHKTVFAPPPEAAETYDKARFQGSKHPHNVQTLKARNCEGWLQYSQLGTLTTFGLQDVVFPS